MTQDSTDSELPPQAVLDELQLLVAKGKAGDTGVVPRIRAIFDRYPRVCEAYGDLDRHVVVGWVEILAGGDLLVEEAILKRAANLRAELEGEAPTPIESLLIGAVVTTWLEMSRAQVTLKGTRPGETSRSTSCAKLADSATKRHLQAIKTLTTVRAQLPRGLMPISRLHIFDPGKKSG